MTIGMNVQPVKCIGATATMTATVSGGVPPYTYTWFSNAATTTTPQPIPENWYSDEFAGVSSSGLTRVCDGTGLNTGISSHSGYCALSFASNTANISCSSSKCLSKVCFIMAVL